MCFASLADPNCLVRVVWLNNTHFSLPSPYSISLVSNSSSSQPLHPSHKHLLLPSWSLFLTVLCAINITGRKRCFRGADTNDHSAIIRDLKWEFVGRHCLQHNSGFLSCRIVARTRTKNRRFLFSRKEATLPTKLSSLSSNNQLKITK